MVGWREKQVLETVGNSKAVEWSKDIRKTGCSDERTSRGKLKHDSVGYRKVKREPGKNLKVSAARAKRSAQADPEPGKIQITDEATAA